MLSAAIGVMAVFTFLGCIVSALHYALRDYNVVKLQAAASGREEHVESLLLDMPGHVLATGALRTLSNVAITVCAVLVFGVFRIETVPGGGNDLTLMWSGLIGAVLTSSALIYLFGIVIPMSIAEHAGERLIFIAAGPLRLIHLLAWPLRALGSIDAAIKRVVGAEHVSEEDQLKEDIISVVTEGERDGNLDLTERTMIEAIVRFKSRTVEEIMTPRTEMEGIELTDDLMAIQKFVLESGHSRIPVYQGDFDHIVGVLYAKDLIKYLGTDPARFKLRPALRRPVWVPEAKPLNELLFELRARKVHMAVVLDEYGGTTGLVTFEDLLEEIVGEIQDEYEPLSESLPVIDVTPQTHSAEVEARAYISDVNSALEPLGVQVPPSEEYDTVGGYVLSKLGRIPVAGETFAEESFLVTIVEAEATRVLKLRIESLPDEPPAPDQEAERETEGSVEPSETQSEPTAA